jgi:hypothetical protein
LPFPGAVALGAAVIKRYTIDKNPAIGIIFPWI